jgi:anti-sigma factor RsiW
MIDRAFVGDLPPERWKDLSAHLEQCSACRAYHDRLGLIDEAMGRSPLTAAMRDRIAEQVMAAASGGRPRARFR